MTVDFKRLLFTLAQIISREGVRYEVAVAIKNSYGDRN